MSEEAEINPDAMPEPAEVRSVSFLLSVARFEQLKARAESQHRKVSQEIRRAIEHYMAEEERAA